MIKTDMKYRKFLMFKLTKIEKILLILRTRFQNFHLGLLLLLIDRLCLIISRHLRLRHFWLRRIPRTKECRPDNRSQEHHIELVADRNESKVEKLDWDPKDPLCLLCLPEYVGNALIDLFQIQTLHGSHGAVVHGIRDPTPIHKLNTHTHKKTTLKTFIEQEKTHTKSLTYLFHNGLEHRNIKSCHT